MIEWREFDLARAAFRLAIANSPMFLLDGLRSDGEVARLAIRYSSNDILSEFEKSLTETPSSFEDRAKPYILIAASSLKDDQELLEHMAKVARDFGGWASLLTAANRDDLRRPVFSTISGTVAPSKLTTPSIKLNAATNFTVLGAK